MKRKPELERFTAKYKILDEPQYNGTPCWEWQGYKGKNGYGRFVHDNGGQLAHRFAYSIKHGKISQGLQIDHLCRNRACVNPDHLEAVTQHENILRGEAGRHNGKSARTHCSSGHPLSGENLIISAIGYRQCRECRNTRTREFYRRRKAQWSSYIDSLTPKDAR